MPNLPSRSGGIDFAWISVILLKPISATALSVLAHTRSSREANDESERILVGWSEMQGTTQTRAI